MFPALCGGLVIDFESNRGWALRSLCMMGTQSLGLMELFLLQQQQLRLYCGQLCLKSVMIGLESVVVSLGDIAKRGLLLSIPVDLKRFLLLFLGPWLTRSLS